MARRKQKTQPKTREERAMAAVKAARGIERKEHFEAGKPLGTWIPARTMTKNRRRVASRRACRGRVAAD